MRLDDGARVVLTTSDNQRHNFLCLRDALLFAWDRGPENVLSITVDGEAIMMQEAIWRA